VKGVARSAAIGARVAGAPSRHPSPDMVRAMDFGAPTRAQPVPAAQLPPPPPPPPAGFAAPAAGPTSFVDPTLAVPPKIAGRLTQAWRFAFTFGWAAIVVGYAAVWESSRVIGLSTWWLGPDSEPRLLLMQLLPFYGPLLVTIAAISNLRNLPYLGIVVAVINAAIGAGDLGRVRWIATVELVLAGAALCISVASLAGMYRPARAYPVT
ncbi:MAG: hypothetical protein ABI894_08240, partial [Ilumatobacteraceae bacterium]